MKRKREHENFKGGDGCKYGTVYGYKKLIPDNWTRTKFISPQKRGFEWHIGKWAESDEIPTPQNYNGIYIVKNRWSRELEKYDGIMCFLEGSGWYVEHEYGYRVEFAKILKVEEDEN